MPFVMRKRSIAKRKELIDAVVEGLRDPDAVNRLRTLERACRLRRPPVEALPSLILALEDSSVYVRQLAAFTLGRVAAPESVPMLITALEDEDMVVRFCCINALKKIDTPDAHRAVRDADIDQWDQREQKGGESLEEEISKHF